MSVRPLKLAKTIGYAIYEIGHAEGLYDYGALGSCELAQLVATFIMVCPV